ncbi:hypothetical protein [Pseudaestuariivita rosea]|uniref:hypothetical protein n=1 Tax=Pseudaestuariivita rosea TaxID=2763263 RepID=UPI001ABBDB0D|nr:hypothetical protein [Pseudaestuariivita rosea]
MKLDKLVLIIGCVIAGIIGTGWLMTLLFASFQTPLIGVFILPVVGLVSYIGWRIVSDRLGNPEEDHYDSIEK